jgi:hypothetical protein
MGMQVIASAARRMALVAGLTAVGLTAFSPIASADPTKGMTPAKDASHSAVPMGARQKVGGSTEHKSSGSFMKAMYHQVAAHH